jgi:hypothetical protein
MRKDAAQLVKEADAMEEAIRAEEANPEYQALSLVRNFPTPIRRRKKHRKPPATNASLPSKPRNRWFITVKRQNTSAA